MKVTSKTRLQARLQNVLFVFLLVAVVGLLGWLSTVYGVRSDWTAGHRNSLTPASRQLLGKLDKPVQITVFATTNRSIRQPIRTLIEKYQRADKHVSLKFVDPDVEPQRVRRLGIKRNGELVLRYGGRTQKVQQPDERSVTNALARLARSTQREVVFLTGHGELAPNHDGKLALSDFVKTLRNQGFKVASVNLAQTPRLPKNTAAMVIAGPRTDYLPGETRIIQHYVTAGGNLLWLGEPGSEHGLQPLAKMLGVKLLNGTIVDSTAPLFGVKDVRWVVLNRYLQSPVTQDFGLNTLWPETAAVSVSKNAGWKSTPFLESRALPRSWLETGPMTSQVSFDAKSGDRPGPLDIGVLLSRKAPAKDQSGSKAKAAGLPENKADAAEHGKHPPRGPDADMRQGAGARGRQRVAVLGDADFLANAYVGYGGNQNLGLNLMNWLSHDDRYINIHPPRALDHTLALSGGAQLWMAWWFLVLFPGLLLIAGLSIWWRRRRR